MSTALTATLAPVLKGLLLDTTTGTVAWGQPAWPFQFPFPSTAFAAGAGAGKLQWPYIKERSVGAGANDILNLNDGSLLDEFGNALVFTSVKIIALYNEDAAITLDAGGAASNAWEGWTPVAGSKLYLPPGGLAILAAPSAYATAVDGTHKNFQVHNPGGAAVSYQIAILG